MNEEKKEQPQEVKQEAKEATAAPEEATTPKEATQETKPQAPASQEKQRENKKTEGAAPVKEKPSNCAGCNKSIRKKRWYYRNGKFYCTKRCWQSSLKKEEAPKDAS